MPASVSCPRLGIDIPSKWQQIFKSGIESNIL
jgi:hypothetical protein